MSSSRWASDKAKEGRIVCVGGEDVFRGCLVDPLWKMKALG